MTVLQWIWCLSALGAVSFVAAGYLWGSRRLSVVMARYEEDHREVVETCDRLKAERDAVIREVEAVAKQRDSALSQVAALEGKLQSQETSARYQSEQMKAQLSSKERTEEENRRELVRLRSAVDRCAALEQEVGHLRHTLGTAKRALAEVPKLRKAASERDALLLDLDLTKRSLQELGALKERAKRAEALRGLNEQLERRLVQAIRELKKIRGWGLAPPTLERPRDTHPTLEATMRPLASSTGHRSSVVADELGFPIGGSGEQQEPLAALCGLLIELQERMGYLLPVGPVRRVTLEGGGGLTVSACTINKDEVHISLATLTEGPGLPTPLLRGILSDAAAALTAVGKRVSSVGDR